MAVNMNITGSLTTSQTAGIIGTTTNNNASAGSVGEFISSTIAVSSAVALATGTPANITSISLTAGDWQIWGNIGITVADGTATLAAGWISATSATFPDGSLRSTFSINGATFFAWSGAAPTLRASLSGTTTYYLSCQYTSGGTAGAGYGGIYARRLR